MFSVNNFSLFVNIHDAKIAMESTFPGQDKEEKIVTGTRHFQDDVCVGELEIIGDKKSLGTECFSVSPKKSATH
jgi:hypothetical protein